MWWGIAILATCACGRIGFEARDAAQDSPHDAAPDFDFDYNFLSACPSGLVLVGDAACAGGGIELTQPQMNQAGAVYLASPITIGATTAFSTNFAVQIVPPSMLPPEGTGDGMTFVVHADPRGNGALGDGGWLGLGGVPRITPSVAVELDTHLDLPDPGFDHVAITLDGNDASVATGAPPFALDSGAYMRVWVDYDPQSQVLRAFVGNSPEKPAVPIASYVYDLTVLGSSVWFGLTGGTAEAIEGHELLTWTLDVSP